MYLTAVKNALSKKLNADINYTMNICKNPGHEHWHTYAPNDAPESYTLGELSEWLELDSWNSTAQSMKHGAAVNDSAFSRNVSLFNGIRKQCYKLASTCDQRSLLTEIIALADAYNREFDDPLPSNEIMNTARSIYRYCTSARFQAAKAESDARFSALQAKRGSKSKRSASATSERTQQPWRALGISRATYYRQKAKNTSEK